MVFGQFYAFLMGPMGIKTSQFWGPLLNWGFVVAGIMDMNKPAEKISRNMTTVLLFYSSMFARFAWRVKPRNYLLMACHITNVSVQAKLLHRKISLTT